MLRTRERFLSGRDPVLAGRLGLVERGVRARQQLLGRPDLGEGGDAEAGGDVDRLPLGGEDDPGGADFPDPLGHGGGAGEVRPG